MEFDRNWLSDPAVFSVGRLPAHAAYSALDGHGRALSASMDGVWKFCWAPSPEEAPAGFSSPSYSVQRWDDISVPGAFCLQGGGRWGAPQYVNVMYPWDGSEKLAPGEVPRRFNPVGTYVRDFVLPREWSGPVHVQFDGADSALAVWCNGSFVGYSEDSFTPAAFDLSPFLDYKARNRIAVQVFRFCSGSWLEDQDFWRMPGLFRSVTLYALPRTHFADIDAQAVLNDTFTAGALRVKVKLQGELHGKVTLEMEGRRVQAFIDSDTVGIALNVENPLLWSAEAPHLYAYTLQVLDEYDNVVEQVNLRAGFRRFELQNGLMMLNGKRIVFKGVNRHEWDCRTGRTVTREDMKADILAMKHYNINAVRTSHYPNAAEWYDLCDAYGLYVIDEMNLETHGTWQKPGSRRTDENTLPGDHAEWRAAVLDRAASMLERDKNHPCILLWSCGNESGGGQILFEVSEYFRRRDPSRLVHYEGIYNNRRYPATSDIESQMYPTVAAIEAFLQNNPEKPFICCEYSHAMGNSCGALHEYTDLAAREARYQGGFIWDWIDQGLMVKTPGGKLGIAYGGDFGDRPTDGDFCCNGLLFADRTPSPKLQEVAACYQDFELIPSKYDLTVHNRSLFTDLSHYTLHLELHRAGVLCESREVRAAAAPGETAVVPLPFVIPAEPGEYTVTARAVLRQALPWAPAGHAVASGQCVVRRERHPIPCLTGVQVTEGDYNIGVQGEGFRVLFSRVTGQLVSYRLGGAELFPHPPELSFWRAPTSNDRGCAMPFEYAAWKTAGPCARLVQCGVFATPQRADITAVYLLPTPGRETVTVCFGVTGDGRVETRITWNGEADETLVPEFGMQFTLPVEYGHVEYYGRGPLENYADRRRGALLGRYAYEAAQNVTPYMTPQECGNRTDVRSAAVLCADGSGMLFESEQGMDVSVLPYTAHELENARHPFELPGAVKTVVRCSCGQMGIGGDDSWGAKPHEQYLCRLVPGTPFRFSFCGVRRR